MLKDDFGKDLKISGGLGNALNDLIVLESQSAIRSLAFPAIGTGVFKFPVEQCAESIINGFKKI
jgi:O-acetyl-ADP-ribose deacetylase (regulator of RNase III)